MGFTSTVRGPQTVRTLARSEGPQLQVLGAGGGGQPPIQTLADAQQPGAQLWVLSEQWLDSRRLNCAPATLDLYRYVIQDQLLTYLASRGVTDPQQVRTRHLEGWAGQLLDGTVDEAGDWVKKPLKPISVDSRVRTAGYFLNWLWKEDEITKQVQLPTIKVPKEVLTVLDKGDMARLVKAADNERDRLILTVLTDTGCRAQELCDLRTTDVFRQGSRYFARIHGKGAKERLVGLRSIVYNQLAHYVQSRQTQQPWLFVSLLKRDSGVDHTKLTPHGLRDIVQKAADAAGLDRHVKTHLLRHSATTAALKGKVPEQAIIQNMGWTDDRMLRRHYAHISAEDTADAFMEFLNQDQHTGTWTGRYQKRSA